MMYLFAQYRYLSLIETPCGFNHQLLDLLAETLKQKPDLKRHGILLIDEVSTRRNIRLDTKTMTYKGFVVFGGGTLTTDVGEMADHGLFFIFDPIMDDCTQPIAVFTSKGPTAGVM